MQTHIRKWGNSSGVLIPAAALSSAGLKVGDTMDVEVRNGTIVLLPATPEYTLSDLLKASPEGSFAKTEEDQAWLNFKLVGKEFWLWEKSIGDKKNKGEFTDRSVPPSLKYRPELHGKLSVDSQQPINKVNLLDQ